MKSFSSFSSPTQWLDRFWYHNNVDEEEEEDATGNEDSNPFPSEDQTELANPPESNLFWSEEDGDEDDADGEEDALLFAFEPYPFSESSSTSSCSSSSLPPLDPCSGMELVIVGDASEYTEGYDEDEAEEEEEERCKPSRTRNGQLYYQETVTSSDSNSEEQPGTPLGAEQATTLFQTLLTSTTTKLPLVREVTQSFKEKLGSWKRELISNVASVDERLRQKFQEYSSAPSVPAASVSRCSAADPSSDEEDDLYLPGTLVDGAKAFWKELVEENVPKKIEEIRNTSSILLRECLPEAQCDSSSSTFDKIRSKSLLEAFDTFQEKSSQLYNTFKQLLQQDVGVIARDAYTDALRRSQGIGEHTRVHCQEAFTQAGQVSVEAAAIIRDRFSEILNESLVQLESVEKELDRSLQRIVFVVKSKEEARQKQQQQQQMHYLVKDQGQFEPGLPQLDVPSLDPALVKLMLEPMLRPISQEDQEGLTHKESQGAPCGKRSRLGDCSPAAGGFTPFDDTIYQYFRPEKWEEFFLSATGGYERFARLDQQIVAAGLSVTEVKSDSHSQFRALSHQLYSNEESYGMLRSLLAKEISNNLTSYSHMLSIQGTSAQDYLDALSKDATGDHVTLAAFANFYGGNVLIYSPLFMQPLLIRCRVRYTSKVFCLCYQRETHYQSLVSAAERPAPELARAGSLEQIRPLKKPKKRSVKLATPSSPDTGSMQVADDLQKLEISALDFLVQPLLGSLEFFEPKDAGSAVPALPAASRPAADAPASLTQPTPQAVMPIPTPAVPAGDMKNLVRSCQSLVDLCVHKISDSVATIPSPESVLPEELLQKLLVHLVSEGKIDDFVLPRLVSPSFTTLDLARCKGITDSSCHFVGGRCRALKRLSLAGCVGMSGRGLEFLARNCPQLQSLDLNGCFNISPITMQSIATYCPELRSLNLSRTKACDETLRQFFASCANLEWLNLRDCTQITDAGMDRVQNSIRFLDLTECRISDRTIYTLAERCGELRSLRISCKTVTDQAMIRLSQACRLLQELHLLGCDCITDATVQAVAVNCLALRAFTLSFCKNITDAGFAGFPAAVAPVPSSSTTTTSLPDVHSSSQFQGSFAELQLLNLARCINITDRTLQQLARQSPKLKVLNLSSCEDITDAAVAQLVRACTEIEDLDLSKCVNVTDAAVTEIGRCCPKLKKLCLYNCHHITDLSITQLASRCADLKHLDLTSCEQLTDEALRAIASGCRGLRFLSLEECPLVTDGGLACLAEGCSQLQTLRMAYCKGVTDLSLHSLARACRDLSSLDLSYCNNITVPGLQQAMGAWPKFATLSLRGCNNISHDVVQHPNLRNLNLSWCSNLEDAAISKLARSCPSLEELDVAWCSKLTGEHVRDLAQMCNNLRFLNLRGCTQVTFLALKALPRAGICIYR